MGWGEWGEQGGKETKTAREGGRGRGASAFETPNDQMQNPSASETIAAAAATGWEPRGAPSGAVCRAWWPARRSPACGVQKLWKRGALSDSETLQGCNNRRWEGKNNNKKRKKDGAKVTKSHLLGRIKTDTPAKHTRTHSHTHARSWRKEEKEDAVRAAAVAANGSLRACRNVQVLRALRNARVIGASSSVPSLPPPLPPRGLLPPPRPPPGLGEAGERNLPLPPLPTPLSLPARPLPPASPPTHPLAGSRLSPVPPPAAAPLPARSTPAPARCSRGENETERKSCSWDSEGRRWGGRVGKLTEQHERRSPFHFLALVLPGFAAISSAGGSEMSVAQVTRDAPQPE